jgi:hypothetical protein
MLNAEFRKSKIHIFNTMTSLGIWSCGSSFTINHLVSGGVAPVDKTVTYGTVTNIPGETSKCRIASNLGSDHQATAVNDASGGWTKWNGPWNSALEMQAAGSLGYQDGALEARGEEGLYWSIMQNSTTVGMGLYFLSAGSFVSTFYKTYGFTLRCIRD